MCSYMHVRLQIVQGILELVTWGSVQRLPHEEGQLVGVLAGGGDPHCAGPVVVEVTQLVGELLDVFRLKPAAVLDHVVGGGIDSSLNLTWSRPQACPSSGRLPGSAPQWRSW